MITLWYLEQASRFVKYVLMLDREGLLYIALAVCLCTYFDWEFACSKSLFDRHENFQSLYMYIICIVIGISIFLCCAFSGRKWTFKYIKLDHDFKLAFSLSLLLQLHFSLLPNHSNHPLVVSSSWLNCSLYSHDISERALVFILPD